MNYSQKFSGLGFTHPNRQVLGDLLRGKPLCIAALAAALLSGCANVKPWEREVLAGPTMQIIESGDEEAYEQHMHRALAQGLITAPAGGSGCGCEQ